MFPCLSRHSSPLFQPSIAGTNDCCGSISHLELAEDVGDVIAHCFGAQHKFGGNIGILRALCDKVENRGVGVALGDQRQKLALALC